MTSFRIVRFEAIPALHRAASDLLEAALGAAPERPSAILLSGGRTPLPVYAALRQRGVRAAPGLGVAFADERHVPDVSPDSNYGQVAPLLGSLGVGAERVLRVFTDGDVASAADRYHRDLARFLEAGGSIPLGLLGLGADGHTASLFSGEDIARGRGRWAIAVRRSPGPDRISVTRDLLIRVEKIIFLVTGPDKRAVLTRLCETPDGVTAGLAVSGAPSVEVWCAGQD
jgi:6-phosphogluconolactonase